MKLVVRNNKLFERMSIGFATTIRLVLNLLLVITVLALFVGVVKSGIDLFHSLHQSLDAILQNMLLDAVFIVALVEVAITILGYLKDGQVHVRYIVDTVLIIMLNEIVSMWFKHPKLENAISLSVIILALAIVRVAVTRFAPKNQN
jgi:uncharacterized membrane protein (DUF373 family)